MTTCQHCGREIWMQDFAWIDGRGRFYCLVNETIHVPAAATPVEEQLGWLGVYAGPPQGWSR